MESASDTYAVRFSIKRVHKSGLGLVDTLHLRVQVGSHRKHVNLKIPVLNDPIWPQRGDPIRRKNINFPWGSPSA